MAHTLSERRRLEQLERARPEGMARAAGSAAPRGPSRPAHRGALEQEGAGGRAGVVLSDGQDGAAGGDRGVRGAVPGLPDDRQRRPARRRHTPECPDLERRPPAVLPALLPKSPVRQTRGTQARPRMRRVPSFQRRAEAGGLRGTIGEEGKGRLRSARYGGYLAIGHRTKGARTPP